MTLDGFNTKMQYVFLPKLNVGLRKHRAVGTLACFPAQLLTIAGRQAQPSRSPTYNTSVVVTTFYLIIAMLKSWPRCENKPQVSLEWNNTSEKKKKKRRTTNSNRQMYLVCAYPLAEARVVHQQRSTCAAGAVTGAAGRDRSRCRYHGNGRTRQKTSWIANAVELK